MWGRNWDRLSNLQGKKIVFRTQQKRSGYSLKTTNFSLKYLLVRAKQPPIITIDFFVPLLWAGNTNLLMERRSNADKGFAPRRWFRVNGAFLETLHPPSPRKYNALRILHGIWEQFKSSVRIAGSPRITSHKMYNYSHNTEFLGPASAAEISRDATSGRSKLGGPALKSTEKKRGK